MYCPPFKLTSTWPSDAELFAAFSVFVCYEFVFWAPVPQAAKLKVKLQSGIYDQTEAFQLLKSDQLAQDKKLTGYIVFPVEKGKKYEVQYERKIYSSDKKSKPLKFVVDSSQYEDKVEASTLLADEYINQVYFSGQRKVKKDDAFVWS